MIEYLTNMLQVYDFNDLMAQITAKIKAIDFQDIFEISSLIIISLVMVWILIFMYQRINDHFMDRRIRKHHLTIRNNGNTRSIFLLRAMDMPKQVALRFRVGGSPLIRVTQAVETLREAESIEVVNQESAETAAPAKAKSKNKEEPSLIPNLSNPMNAVGGAVRNTGRTAGTAASALGYMSTLAPGNSKALAEGQAVLKGFQQSTSDAMNSVSIRVRAFEALKNLFGKLFPKKKDLIQDVTVGDDSASGLQGIDMDESGGIYLPESIRNKNFVYEESAWASNLGKTDSDGGSLNYAQSKVLEPGESMKIDLELMNLSDNMRAVTYFYKIEVLQIPMTKLPLSAPKQIINGIVVFPKLSRLEYMLPPVIMTGMLVLSIQLIAAYIRWIF